MYRRELLSSVSMATAGAVVGCLGPIEGCMDTLTVHFEPLSSADIAGKEAVSENDLDDNPLVEDLVSRTLDGETVEIETMTGAPLSEFTYFQEGGRFHRFDEETVETGEVTGPQYAISRDGRARDVAAEEVLSFADLPRHDQWRVNDALRFSEHGGLLFDISETIVAGYLDPDLDEGSALAAGVDHRYIDFYGSYVEIERGEEETTSVDRIRQSAELIADDTDGFAEHVLRRNAIELTDVDEEVAEVIEEAKANRFGRLVIETCDTRDADNGEYEDAFYELEREIEEARAAAGDPDPIVEDGHPTGYYVQYEGEPHHVQLRE